MFSLNQGMFPQDMDAISDISGISDMNKMTNDECGSEHSGSIGSDNTEILLTQNVSLSELDDSLLESVSQVGEHDAYMEQSFPPSSKRNVATNDYSSLPSYPTLRPVVLPPSEYLPPAAENKYYFLPGQKEIQEPVASHEETRQNQKRGFFPKGKGVGKVDGLSSSSRFSMRKFPSEPNILDGARKSVIKHHGSMPSVMNMEASFVSNSSTNTGDDCVERRAERNGILGQGNKRKSQQVWFHPATYPGDKELDVEDESSTRETRHGQVITDVPGLPTKPIGKRVLLNLDSEESGESFLPDRNAMFDAVDAGDHNIGYEEPLDSDNNGGHRGEIRIEWDSLGEYGGSRGTQGMLLGVKHDPDTNELYDDKVREGADLLSRILGDPNGSFTSFSSISRGSEKSEQPKSLHGDEKTAHYRRSLNSSLSSEPKTSPRPHHNEHSSNMNMNTKETNTVTHKTSSSPRYYYNEHSSNMNMNTQETNGRTTQKTPSSPRYYNEHSSNMNMNTQETNGITTHNKTSQGTTEAMSTHDTRQRNQWHEEQPGINGKAVGHEGTKMDIRSQAPEIRNGYVKQGYSLSHQITRRTVEAAPGSENSFNIDNEISQEHLENRIEELRRLELDIEEIHSRKQMAIQELNVLEQSLNHNKADMSSSESLVEQYRWQATQTRSELMELEEKRNKLQEDCNSLNDMVEKSKRNETFNSDDIILFGRSKEEIFTCLQERDKFERELGTTHETLTRERERGKWSEDNLREKAGILQEQLKKQQQETMERTQKMKEERTSATEILEEKFKREATQLKKMAETTESRIQQLETTLIERNKEVSKLRVLVREEKQKNLDAEKTWRSQFESERQNGEIRADEQERSFKEREELFLHKQSDLENLLEERTADLRRSDERCRSQTEELQKIIENKNEEVKLVRGLVRQQEDATRVLGERLRTESREHVRNAVEKERESLGKDKGRIGRSVDEQKEKHTRIMKQLTEQLEMEKESHLLTKQTMNKLKHEADELRKQVVDVHGERITSVQRARQEGSEELGKIREKLHEFTLQADKMERIDKETAHGIYEECRKVAELVGMPTPLKTPTRFPDEKPERKTSNESPTKEALASLRSCNNELRQKLSEMKKQMDNQRTETDQMKKHIPFEHNEDISKLIQEKDEEIHELHRKYGDEMKHLQGERKKDQMMYKRTVAKLEQEFHKLVPTNVSAGSSRVVKREVTTRNAVSLPDNNLNHAPSYSVLKTTEASSSTDLLKHLQDRVKKLRTENENLKKSSDKETPFNSSKHNGKIKNLSNSDSILSQSKGLTISQLHSSSKNSEMKTRHHSKLSSENIEQVTRLQRLLNSATKDSKPLSTNTG